MNIYARYFEHDELVHSFDELLNFLSSIPDIRLTADMVQDIREYVEGDLPYPKRYRIRPRVYFILIKTNAATMAEFKANRTLAASKPTHQTDNFVKKEAKLVQLMEERYGWYKGCIVFKRVIQIPQTTKFQYQDTSFSAYVKAHSGQDCYNRMIHYLKNRQDVDLRSQFPSAKGQSFQFEYLFPISVSENINGKAEVAHTKTAAMAEHN